MKLPIPEEIHNFVDGVWVPTEANEHFVKRSPATGAALARVARSRAADVSGAVAAAAKARAEGFFDDELLPIEAEQADGSIMKIDRDQAVREGATEEGMADLKPAFKPDGVITAGNASPLNAGATAMVLMSKETAKDKGIKPLATIRSIGFAGVDPTIMGHGPVPASKKALKKAGQNLRH